MDEQSIPPGNNETGLWQPLAKPQTGSRLNGKAEDERGTRLRGDGKNNEKMEKLESLTKARVSQPENPALKLAVYEEFKQVLADDPFLAYQDETEAVYQVVDHHQTVLLVPKDRATPEPFPVRQPEPIQNGYRYLLWATLGLLLLGVGALLFAPAAGMSAARALQSTSPKEHVRARVIILLSMLVFGVGLGLAYLLLIHIRG